MLARLGAAEHRRKRRPDGGHIRLSAHGISREKARSIEEGIDRCRKAIQDGSAYAKFIDLVRAQGGDVESLKISNAIPVEICTGN